MNLVIQFRTTILTFLIAFMLSCFGLSPKVLAVLPAPDGGYPGANTAEGDFALFSLTTGASNTAIGFGALGSNTTGSQNTATGVFALVSNTTGFQNAATGVQALFSNTTGFHNAAAGFQALLANTTGNHNTADGDNALVHDTTGSLNTAIGGHALDHNITGSSNVALGFQAGFNITGSGNVCIGQNIFGNAGESNVTRIRNIGSTVQANGVFVTVGAGGKLGFQASSRRYKDDIKPMDKASEALFSLKPVSFRYKQEIDPARSPDFGLIAEDVAIVNPDLVARDEEGKIVTVRYQAINAMLLNEFLKEHRTVQELKKEVAALMATVKEQASQIQKVNERLEMSRPVPQTVLNNQ
jgi:trimeric autotransporter adhesin